MGYFVDKSIGGYLGMELPFFETNLDRKTVSTNSARSAIKVVLSSVGVQKILLPAYICDAVVEAVEDLEITYEYYRISETFDVDAGVQLNSGEHILIVDYFGISHDPVKRSIDRFGQENTIVDCSQAYFSDHPGALATVWSPRKFFDCPMEGCSIQTTLESKNRRSRTILQLLELAILSAGLPISLK